MTNVTLKTVVFMGSAKTLIPPWGGDARLGDRVLKYVVNFLKKRQRKMGDGSTTINHEVQVLDPVEIFGQGGALEGQGQLAQPHFFFAQGSAPKEMDKIREIIKAADCYVVVSPEYNHIAPPALASLMGHFGGSNYALKPSAIVTYSSGPWGGMRGAMAIRLMLSELGCIPISKLTGFPDPASYIGPDGHVTDVSSRVLNQLPKQVNELEWFAHALLTQRQNNPDPQSS